MIITRPKFLVGCPVSSRNWILEDWVTYLDKAFSKYGADFEIIFLVGSSDFETLDVVTTFAGTHIFLNEEDNFDSNHRWNSQRYHSMVALRNRLLSEVRFLQPDFFLSLDSDILLHEDAIISIMEAFDQHPEACAIGGKCYLSRTGTRFPNYGTWRHTSHWNSFTRKDSKRLQRAGVLMAIKMMKPEAYSIDYKYSQHGEDIGWSANIAEAKMEMWWDGRVCNKHVMSPADHGKIDPRVGF